MDDGTTNKKRMKWLKSVVAIGTIFFIGLAAIVIFCSIPPSDFPTGAIITISRNSGLSKTADYFVSKNVIRSAFLYKAYVVILDRGTKIRAGSYLLSAPESALRVAYRTIYGVEGLPKIKVTIPEGSDSLDMSIILGKNISGFASTTFLVMAKAKEGYLFPDTYFFYQNTAPQDVIDAMSADFDSHIDSASTSISAFVRSLNASSNISSGSRYSPSDIIKMASIVEKEATSSADRRIVAGILWKRLFAGMALQVDPPFYYFLGKTSGDLTANDLKTPSPYNLYLHTGLPPTPIDSPGLDSIVDTITPTATSYWFYISGKDGAMHYAATLEGHNDNIAKYMN
jgi:UPF0755 protein